MSHVKIVAPDEAAQLIEAGYTFVDVRTQTEFEAGHVPGSVNVPLNHQVAGRMVPNPDFMTTMTSRFGKDAKLILGCKSGTRSARAATLLREAGYGDLCDMSAGFDGKRDPFGRPMPGWNDGNRPVERGANS